MYFNDGNFRLELIQSLPPDIRINDSALNLIPIRTYTDRDIVRLDDLMRRRSAVWPEFFCSCQKFRHIAIYESIPERLRESYLRVFMASCTHHQCTAVLYTHEYVLVIVLMVIIMHMHNNNNNNNK